MPSSQSLSIGLVMAIAMFCFASGVATTALAQAPLPAQTPVAKGPVLPPAKMKGYCRSEAATMFGVRRWSIKAGPVKKAVDGGFSIYGRANQGANGKKPFRCMFTGMHEFIAVISLTYEGDEHQ
jgi:hypothetical protein